MKWGTFARQLTPTAMDLGTQSLHDIEGAVETWKRQALPEIEADLLNQAQSRFTLLPPSTAESICARASPRSGSTLVALP